MKAAFWRPIRSRVLGAMPLTQMLLVSFGLAGFFNPGFWLLGLAGVVAFVGGRSASERFQKLVEAERLAARAGSAEDRMKAAYERLEPASQARYRALVVVCREVLGLGAGAGESGLTDFRAGNLNQMLSLFLRLLASREAITDTLARVDRRQLEAGIGSLKTRLAAAGDPEGPLARSLKATLEIQEKRLANLDTATNNLAVIDAELERIEQQVRLVREESAVSRLAGGALRPPRRRLADPRRHLALDGPARGALLGRVRHGLRARLRASPAARAGGRGRGGAGFSAPATPRASARGRDESVIPRNSDACQAPDGRG